MELEFFLEKGILQIISEKVGLDAAKIYWNSVFDLKELDFSHNKKYRIMQELYKKGLLLKIKKDGSFNYIPIPPTAILFNEKLDKETIKILDDAYIDKFLNTLTENDGLIETNGKTLDGLVLFFIRNMMKEKASIIFGGNPIYNLIKEKMKERANNIKFIGIEKYFPENSVFDSNLKLKKQELISEKRMVIIDKNYLLIFFKIFSNTYFGYITKNKERIEEKINEFNFLWNA